MFLFYFLFLFLCCILFLILILIFLLFLYIIFVLLSLSIVIIIVVNAIYCSIAKLDHVSLEVLLIQHSTIFGHATEQPYCERRNGAFWEGSLSRLVGVVRIYNCL